MKNRKTLHRKHRRLKISPISLCDKTMNLRQFPTESATSGVRVVGENPDFPTDEQCARGQFLNLSKPQFPQS